MIVTRRRHSTRTLTSSQMVSVTVGTRLPGGINAACCDALVEYAKLDDLWSYYWHAVSVRRKQCREIVIFDRPNLLFRLKGGSRFGAAQIWEWHRRTFVQVCLGGGCDMIKTTPKYENSR